MSLVNLPKIRVKEYPEGFAVEIQKSTWYGKRYWVHCVSYTGMYDKPFYFSKRENAAKIFCSDLVCKILNE